MMRRLLLAVLLLVIARPAWAQFKEVKPEYEIGEAIVLEVDLSKLPEGAEVQPDFKFKVKTDAKRHEVREPAPKVFHFWGAPGSYEVTAVGMWGVPVPGEPGKWISFGLIWEDLTFKVLGSVEPDPPGPDPPVPGGKYRIVIFYVRQQKENLPSGQQEILNSLVFRDWLKAEGHDLIEIVDPAAFVEGVPASWKPWVDAVLDDPLPRLAITPIEGGKTYVTDYPLPADIPAMKKLLQDPKTWAEAHRPTVRRNGR